MYDTIRDFNLRKIGKEAWPFSHAIEIVAKLWGCIFKKKHRGIS